MKALIGTKLGMTQIFDTDGNVQPVTLIAAGPCTVTQVKTLESDGYRAVQLGYGTAKRLSKAVSGHLKASGRVARTLREVALKPVAEGEEAEVLKIGDQLSVSNFEIGDTVKVTGTSKGKGFAGTIKRHNFHRGPKTHGSRNYRQPGSIGSGYPEHVFKGMRMAGQMGAARVSVSGLKVVALSPEENVLAVSGAVPGPRRGIVMIQEQAS